MLSVIGHRWFVQEMAAGKTRRDARGREGMKVVWNLVGFVLSWEGSVSWKICVLWLWEKEHHDC